MNKRKFKLHIAIPNIKRTEYWYLQENIFFRTFAIFSENYSCGEATIQDSL